MSTDAVAPPVVDIDYSKLVTEDDAPLDSYYQERQQGLLRETLYLSWEPPKAVKTWRAGVNVGVFYAVKVPAIVPDAYVSINVPINTDPQLEENRSYFIWDMGKPPDVVVEMVSVTPGGEDTEKLDIYARMGVDWYVVFDPLKRLSQEVVRVFERKEGELVPTRARAFRRLGLGVTVRPGTYDGFTSDWLRWTDGSGNVLLNKEEVRDLERERTQAERIRADAETERANLERLRAEQVTKQRDAARAEADRLTDLLRKAGIDPDQK